jgi:hypothetical protein
MFSYISRKKKTEQKISYPILVYSYLMHAYCYCYCYCYSYCSVICKKKTICDHFCTVCDTKLLGISIKLSYQLNVWTFSSIHWCFCCLDTTKVLVLIDAKVLLFLSSLFCSFRSAISFCSCKQSISDCNVALI